MVGNLGEVAYDIVAQDKTGEGLDSARSGFVVTAGDIIAQIEKVNDKLQEFAKGSALAAGSSQRVSIISNYNLEADAVQNLAVKYADAATPLNEVLQIEEYLAKQHVTSIDQMDQLIPKIDAFGEANRMNAVTLMQDVTPALKNFNISATDTARYMEPLTYLFANTGISADLYGAEIRRVAPDLSNMNVTFEDTNALLLTAYNRYGDGRTAMSMFTKAEAEAEKQGLTGKAALDYITQSMGLNTEAVDKNRLVIQNHVPQLDKLADAQRSTFTSTENMNEGLKNSTLQFGGLTSVLATVSGPIAAIGQGILGLAVLNTLAPTLTASITGAFSGIASSLGGILSAAGTAIAGSLTAAIGAGLVLGLAGVWVLLKTGVLDALAGLGDAISESDIGGPIMDALKVILAPIGSIGAAIIDIVKGDFADIPEDMAEPFNQAGDAIGRYLDRIRDVASQGVYGIASAFSGLGASLSGASGSITAMAVSAFSGISQAFQGMAGQVRGVFSQMMSSLQTVITSTAGGFYNAGQNIITSMVNGIIAAAGGIINAIKNVFAQIANLIPHSPAKEGPLAELPNWGSYLAGGMPQAESQVKSGATSMVKAAADGLNEPAKGASIPGAAATGQAVGGGDTITIAAGAIVINGAGQNAKEIADMVITQFAAVRKQRGIRS